MASFATSCTSLPALMKEWKLKSKIFIIELEKLGVEEPNDLLDLESTDIDEFLLKIAKDAKKVETNRFRKGYNAMVAAAAAAAAPTKTATRLPIAAATAVFDSHGSSGERKEEHTPTTSPQYKQHTGRWTKNKFFKNKWTCCSNKNKTSIYCSYLPMSLYNASNEGNVSKAKDLLTIKDVNVNEKSVLTVEGGEIKDITPLIVAVWKNHIEIIKILLKREDVDINQRAGDEWNDWSALFVAAAKGHVEAARLLLSRSDIDMNTANNTGYTALTMAAEKCQVEMVQLFLSKSGVDVNQASNEGYTALHKASFEGFVEVVRLLLSSNSGIDVNKAVDFNGIDVNNNKGATALSFASFNGHVKVVELLLAKSDIDINKCNKYTLVTPLHHAVRSACTNQPGNHLEIVRLLLSRSEIDANTPVFDGGETALLAASSEGCLEIVQLLLSKSGIDINLAVNNGDTPLSSAAFNGHIKVVRLLLEQPSIQLGRAIGKATLPFENSTESVKDVIKRRKLVALLEKHRKNT